MARTFRHLWAELTCFDNLWEAYRKARRGKRYTEPAAWFDYRAETNVLRLQEELLAGTYRPGAYHHFFIHEPKRRKISAAPFRDRVVHHALVNLLEPIYEARFSPCSFACRKGRGTHAALESAHAGVRQWPWLLKGDVRKFFPSVDHAVLQSVLFRKIADPQVQWLVRLILASGEGVLAEDCPPQWFGEDDLLAPAVRPKGLPIGNLTSQFFANVLLNELDQFVHETIRPRRYVRYADDFLLFGEDQRELVAARGRVIERLASLRLSCHETKTCVRPCRQGVRFLGFRLLPTTRRLDRQAVNRLRARLRRYARLRAEGRMSPRRITQSVQSWLAHARFANSGAVVRAVLPYVRL